MIKPVHPLIARIPFFTGALFFLLAVISMQFDDVTYDEPDHLQYGLRILQFKSRRDVQGRDFNTTMPVTALNALPRAVEQLFNPGLEKHDWGESDVKNGRYISVFVSLVLLAYIFFFAKAIAGFAAGCWAMLLGALDPNILAYGRVVTTDIYSTLAFVMTLYHLYEWLVNKKQGHFYAWAIAIAFAQCCKVNNICLYPVCLIAIIAWHRSIPRKSFWKKLLLFIGIQLLVINVFFLFYKTGLPLADYQFKSDFFQEWQHGALAKIPLPFPESFIATYDRIQYERETFDGIPMNYLLGELRYKQGFPQYYIVCWALKTPLLTQLLLILSVIFFLRIKDMRRRFLFFFLVPAVMVLVLISASSVQSGYRYLLPILSICLVFCGVLVSWLLDKRSLFVKAAFILAPVIVLATSFPNLLSYTNSLIPDKKMAYRYLADCNLHWGQRQKKIQKILASHPEYVFEPARPRNGLIVVEVNNLVGINAPARYSWLRERYKPVAILEDSYLVFDVRDQPKP